MENKTFVTIAGQFSAGRIVAAARAMVVQRCMPCGRTLVLQQIQRIVSAGTPDLSGRMFNCACSLPHECGVPPQCPVSPMLCNFLVFGLYYEKLGFTTQYSLTRCVYDELNRAVSGEFRMVRPKQYLRSLTNRSGDKVVPPQLPSGRWFMFRSCRLPATSTCGISHSRIALRFARQSPLTRGQGVKIAGIPMNR